MKSPLHIEGELVGSTIYIKDVDRVLSRTGKSLRMCKFQCKCGNFFEATYYYVRRGGTSTCGCSHKEKNKTHGLSKRGEGRILGYYIWVGIKRRCLNPENEYYKWYGAKGISISDEWVNSFEKFSEDMGRRPTLNHSLDRIDGEKGYSKENCRWATPVQQANNKVSNRFISYRNQTKTMAEWCRELQIDYTYFKGLMRNNMSMEHNVTLAIIHKVKNYKTSLTA